MGRKIEKKIIVLIVLFLITSIFVSITNKQVITKDKPLLKNYFKQVDGYKTLRNIQLSEEHTNMLNLDDYLYADYKGNDGTINLYIGYYYTAKKAYASHSPLICYPSQGWEVIEKPRRQTLDIGNNSINFEEIITGYGNEKELVLYWWQSYLQTNTQIYKNKVDMGYNKFMYKTEEHAFVRVSVPLTNSTYDVLEKAAIDFIKVFYPQFIDFIRG